MTPLNNSEVNKIVEDIATLKKGILSLEEWRGKTERKDEAQDRALLRVENDVKALNLRCDGIEKIYKDNKKWVLRVFWALVALFLENIPANTDSVIWNFIHHFSEK